MIKDANSADRSSPPLISSPPVDNIPVIPSRPNRWEGSSSTWRGLTADERNLVESLDQQRDLDLSVQLFNVHVLRRDGLRARKRQQREHESQGDPVQTFSDSDDSVHVAGTYVPAQRWTAWPVSKELLPRDDFMGTSRGTTEDDRFTFRHSSASNPRQVIKEELAATILCFAKERFQKRMEAAEKIHASIEESDISEAPNNGDEEMSNDDDEDSETSGDEDSEISGDADHYEEHQEAPQYEAVVSADDGLSERILQPSIQHILGKVDDLLRVLHNSRLATISYMHDGSASGSEDFDGKDHPEPGSTVSKDPSTDPQISSIKNPTAPPSPQPQLARPLPIDPRLLSEPLFPFPSTQPGSSQPMATKAAIPKAPPIKKRAQAMSTTAQRSQHREEWLARWNLRNWHDVLFAASHAGFSQAVIARTAQRCADLFDTPITLTSMQETVPQRSTAPYTETYITPQKGTARYKPVDPVAVSINLGHLPTDFGEIEIQRLRAQFSNADRPGSASSRMMYCPVISCHRSTQGFDRYSNLRRHVLNVHNMTPPPPPSRSRSRSQSKDTPSKCMRRAGTPGISLPGSGAEDGTTDTENEDSHGLGPEEDSEDEMDGAVHVDGFLKPFRLKRGWRGGDTLERRGRKGLKKRRLAAIAAGEEIIPH
ncbi:hypothetical protein Cpir12675_001468 [Ceratocystis pirilliformis]|uniref:Rrn9 domain-containing protein n=1 Tax=Ceratocystis pirilliformis TaxID=259994 RepID=A0ABR3ZGN6_9PEZI